MANPTPAPNELSSCPAHAEQGPAAAREKPDGITVASPSQEGGGDEELMCAEGPILACPQAQDPRITAVLVGHGAEIQAETPSPGLGAADPMGHMRWGQASASHCPPGIPSPLPSGRSLMGSGLFSPKSLAHPNTPGRPRLLPAAPGPGTSIQPAPGRSPPARRSWRTDAAAAAAQHGAAGSARPTNLPHTCTPLSLCPQGSGGA